MGKLAANPWKLDGYSSVEKFGVPHFVAAIRLIQIPTAKGSWALGPES